MHLISTDCDLRWLRSEPYVYFSRKSIWTWINRTNVIAYDCVNLALVRVRAMQQIFIELLGCARHGPSSWTQRLSFKANSSTLMPPPPGSLPSPSSECPHNFLYPSLLFPGRIRHSLGTGMVQSSTAPSKGARGGGSRWGQAGNSKEIRREVPLGTISPAGRPDNCSVWLTGPQPKCRVSGAWGPLMQFLHLGDLPALYLLTNHSASVRLQGTQIPEVAKSSPSHSSLFSAA